jgi:CheY-like chemotaxis protein
VDNVEVKLDLADDLPALWCDPHQLHQVLVNLITNADQAMHQTPPPRQLRLTTRFHPTEGRVSLEVADTGPGIPREIQSRVFEPFFTTKPSGQGTGLGLSLCHGIVENHGGTIRVTSPPGQGAVFRVELPVVAAPTSGPEAPLPEGGAPIRGKTILVVDDESKVASVLVSLLSADGHQVDRAANGVIALDKLRARAYDLILSDIKMPELDGPGLYRALEREQPELCRRFVFLTGDTLSPETRAFLEQTEASSLAKPFALAEVRQAVRRALANK